MAQVGNPNMCFVPGGKYRRITSTFPSVTHLHFFFMCVILTYLYVLQNIFYLHMVQFCPWYGTQGKQWQQSDQQCSCLINEYVNDLHSHYASALITA